MSNVREILGEIRESSMNIKIMKMKIIIAYLTDEETTYEELLETYYLIPQDSTIL